MAELMKTWDRIKHFRLSITNYDVFLQICSVLLASIHITLMYVM